MLKSDASDGEDERDVLPTAFPAAKVLEVAGADGGGGGESSIDSKSTVTGFGI